MIDIDTAGTLLFVPGDRPDRFRKAVDSGADLVVIDLEDAVPPAGKDAARRNVGRWLDAGHRCAVRINAFDTVEGDADLQWLTGRDCPVMLPKAEDARRIVERLGDHAVLALIETASGVLNAATVAAATPVRRLAFGSFDLAAHLGSPRRIAPRWPQPEACWCWRRRPRAWPLPRRRHRRRHRQCRADRGHPLRRPTGLRRQAVRSSGTGARRRRCPGAERRRRGLGATCDRERG